MTSHIPAIMMSIPDKSRDVTFSPRNFTARMLENKGVIEANEVAGIILWVNDILNVFHM